jgi:hypothetical protein
MKRFLWIIMLAVTLCLVFPGCASGTRFQDAKSSIPELSPENGRFYFYRSNSPVGAAIQPTIYLNEDPVGKAVPGGVFFLDKSPGEYQIRTTTEVKRSLSITLEPGQQRYIRFDITPGFFAGHVSPKLIDSEKAQKEISGCKMIVK